MSLLVLDRVTKRYGERTALHSVSLRVDAGELLAVWGRRHSGRSTLLAVAAGIERADSGTVRFGGKDVTRRQVAGVLGGIGYCSRSFPPAVGRTVAEQVSMPLLGQGSSIAAARHAAENALDRVDALGVASVAATDLGHADVARVALARALVSGPRMLMIDQPTAGVSIATERDVLLDLLRSIADDGIAVLMTVDEGAELAGTDRAVTIDSGELHGDATAPAADVIPLRRSGHA